MTATSPADNRAINPIVGMPYQEVRSYLRHKTKKAAKPGMVFAYNGAQSAVLGLLLSERVGKNLTAHLEAKIWNSIAEDHGYWIKTAWA